MTLFHMVHLAAIAAEPLDWLQSAGYTGKVKIGMDVAASEFYNKEDNKYDLDFKNQGTEKHDKSQTKTG